MIRGRRGKRDIRISMVISATHVLQTQYVLDFYLFDHLQQERNVDSPSQTGAWNLSEGRYTCEKKIGMSKRSKIAENGLRNLGIMNEIHEPVGFEVAIRRSRHRARREHAHTWSRVCCRSSRKKIPFQHATLGPVCQSHIVTYVTRDSSSRGVPPLRVAF